ncbi:UNVERIFIED_CONTAM: putative 2-oxoglutarate-dependent dioxygenase AOP1 [Sesamum latifolium]|uniref:2-oxoglutarate-dependent dioxygenase AOP1 n=1 Tax=Sesamum latifolium TaxID=2727402 RepID=A0AAW2YFU5_9LAMI
MAEIPIIDLSTKTLDTSSSSWVSACKNVQHALEEYGFFLARYDDFPSELDKQVFDVMEELFDLPLETKTRNSGELAYHGESISRYVKVVSELEQKVDKMVFESYGAEKHYESHVGSTTYLLRTLKYSAPDSNNSSNNNNIGANIHTDKNFLTVIHQNQVNGLEIQPRNGEWFAVELPPGPGSFFVVMAGDSYQAWSNGRMYSARHQVLMKGDKPRYSLALFSYNHGTTHIPEELVDTEHPLQFKPFDSYGLLRFYLSRAPSDMSGSSAKEYCGVTA